MMVSSASWRSLGMISLPSLYKILMFSTSSVESSWLANCSSCSSFDYNSAISLVVRGFIEFFLLLLMNGTTVTSTFNPPPVVSFYTRSLWASLSTFLQILACLPGILRATIVAHCSTYPCQLNYLGALLPISFHLILWSILHLLFPPPFLLVLLSLHLCVLLLWSPTWHTHNGSIFMEIFWPISSLPLLCPPCCFFFPSCEYDWHRQMILQAWNRQAGPGIVPRTY